LENQSEIDWQKDPYTLSDLAKDAISIIDAYGIKKAHFIGDSMGGWVSQRIGIDYPEKVLSLVIISAGPVEITKEWLIPLTEKEQKILDETLNIFNSRSDGNNLEETVQNFLPIWRHSNADIPLDEEMAKKFTYDFLTRGENKNFMNHEKMMQNFLSSIEKSNDLKQIKKPTLVIYGEKDPVVLPRHTISIADAISGAKLIMIEGMGHTFFNRDLEEKIAKFILDFLKINYSKDINE